MLIMKRMADEARFTEWDYVEDSADPEGRLKKVPSHVMVYEISGPMFFGPPTRYPIWRRTPAKLC